MARLRSIILRDGTSLAVLHEDPAVLAVDKPAGWLLAPESWCHTPRNLQRVLRLEIESGAPWAASRRIRFLRFIHRLDADTSGVLLLARSPGALRAFSRLFATRAVCKWYLAVVAGRPRRSTWVCRYALAPDPHQRGRMRAVSRGGQPAETRFLVVDANADRALVVAEPVTGRTHQIRVHLAGTGHPVLGDRLYGPLDAAMGESPLALRAWQLAYRDPFRGRSLRIEAPITDFLERFGFAAERVQLAVPNADLPAAPWGDFQR